MFGYGGHNQNKQYGFIPFKDAKIVNPQFMKIPDYQDYLITG